MKCIKNTDGEIRRVRDDQAADQVKSGNWMYVPKSEWKDSRKTTKKSEKRNDT